MRLGEQRARWIGGAAFLSFMMIASPALAGPHEESVARFDEGRALVKSGHPADAIPKFIASLAAEPSAVAALNLADCYERVGKLASARVRFEEAGALSTAAGDRVRASEARKRAEILVPRLMTITILPPPGEARVSAWVDGSPVAAEDLGKPKAFDPGPHEVVIQTANGKRQTKVITLAEEGTKATVTFDAEPRAEAPPEKRTPVEPDANASQPPPSDSLRTVAYVTGGIGIASIIVGGVTGVVALNAKADLESACADYPRCPPSRRAELDDTDSRGRSMSTISTITIAAGAALIATGVIFWIVSGSSNPDRAPEKLRALRAVTGGISF